MSQKSYKKAYKSLNIEEYIGVIKNTLVPFLDPIDGEYIATLTPNTRFTVEKHYNDGLFYGWKVYANGVLLETKNTKRKAKKFVNALAEL